MNRTNFFFYVLLWISFIAFAFIWNLTLVTTNTSKLALKESRAFFNQIVISREWNARHGGVYVPVTEGTQPNKYIIDSLRDIRVNDRLLLTKINPAYMTRQVSEINKERLGLQFHITSLNPVRAENRADDWEMLALKSFEEDRQTEVFELIGDRSGRVYRYMAPLVTEQSCLKCHAHQGYQVGDIRGDISINVPAGPYLATGKSQLTFFTLVLFTILVAGIFVSVIYYQRTNSYYRVIEAKNQELEHMNATKDTFFSIIAHDLRSPLGALIGLGEMLHESHASITHEKREELIDILNRNSKKTFTLLNNLLQWASNESGQLRVKPLHIPLFGSVASNLMIFDVNIREKQLVIHNQVDKSLGVYADADMFQTIIRNLLSNAIKFTPAGGAINIQAEKWHEGFVRICIADTGVGISDEAIMKIMSRDVMFSTMGTNKEKGTGLGLKLCREFVEKNKGTMTIESVPGQWTRICFSLPESLNL